jgi:hypothetical protein
VPGANLPTEDKREKHESEAKARCYKSRASAALPRAGVEENIPRISRHGVDGGAGFA